MKISIDDEVYNHLLNHSTFEDDVNSVLRRLLGINKTPNKSVRNIYSVQQLNKSMPVALTHTLEVVSLVKNKKYDRSMATNSIANKYKIATQTVLDKYCRQLQLTTGEFDLMLIQPGLYELKKILKRKYINHISIIDKYFDEHINSK
jgi:predicted CopG family antitoxin